jgi:dienelactone hydrolase
MPRMGQSIILYHSAYGLRPAVLRFADALRAAGHGVATPDLYDGEVFSRLEDGIRKRDSLGVPEIMRRASAAVQATPSASVFAGFSLGAAAAFAVGTRYPGARALLLMHGALNPEAVGMKQWPAGLAVNVHYAKADPWVDEGDVTRVERAARAAGARFASFTYECTGHLFADEELPDYDAPSAALILERTLQFLDALA